MISFAFAEEFFPSNILMMDEKFAHHVILVEKATHKVHLYENGGTNPKLVKTYNTATGKFKGDKSINGDHKTPEGIYSINDFFTKEELLRRHGKYAEIYGAGAFFSLFVQMIEFIYLHLLFLGFDFVCDK